LILIMIIILWQSGDPTQDQEQDHDQEQEKAVSGFRSPVSAFRYHRRYLSSFDPAAAGP